jgi:hypothetical protein
MTEGTVLTVISFAVTIQFSVTTSDLSGETREQGTGMAREPKAFPFGEGFERPENSPVDCFQ